MKIAGKFVPATDIQKAIVKGDHRGLLAVLRPLSPAARQQRRPEVSRIVKAIKAANFAYGDQTFAGWGYRPKDNQQQAAAVASLLCGTADEVAEQWFDIDQLIAVGKEFSPPALRELATALMKAPAWQSHIHDVQKLIGAGLSPRPDCDEYVLGLMLLFSNQRNETTTFARLFAQDPGLTGVLLRILEVEGTQDVSLTSVDKYVRRGKSWAQRLVELCDQGVYPRALLIDKALSSLERGWIQYRSGWFSGFHELLAPTVEEMHPHAARYLALAASRIPPTVTFALHCVAALDEAGRIHASELLAGLRPVFSSAVKGQIEAGLKILDRLVKRDATHAPSAAQWIVPALGHESAQVQKQVLKRLAEWDTARVTSAALGVYSTGIAAVNRAAFDALAGAPQKTVPVKPVTAPLARVPRNPLDAEFVVAPIEMLDELIERTAYVFENDTDADEFARVVAGLVRFAPFDHAACARFAAVAKRAGKVRKPVPQQAARLLHFLLTGERLETPPTQNYFGHPNLVAQFLSHRIDGLMKAAKSAAGSVPLATPTHRRGFIDPTVLARRLGGYQRRGVTPIRGDFLDALMRLGPPDERSLAAARELETDDFARALRLILGDAIEPRDRELAAVAQRVKVLLARRPPAARAWKVASKKFKYGVHSVLEIEPSAALGSKDPVALLEKQAARIEIDGWYEIGAVGSSDEGSICFYATMLPSDLENFCAEGAALVSRNIDWFQAHWEHKAYLRVLLHPTAAMGPMATLLLALGLACKEAGETAVAVDVLVQSVVEGRLDVKLLARDIAELLRAEQTSCARYGKSLRAALRIDASVAPALAEVLCAAVVARPTDPPKDTPALLELLLEIMVRHDLPLPEGIRAALEAMQFGGKGKALRTELLGRR